MLRTALEEAVRIAVVAVFIRIDSGLVSWTPSVRAAATAISGRTRSHRYAFLVFIGTVIKLLPVMESLCSIRPIHMHSQ